jgi:hypothetical protein
MGIHCAYEGSTRFKIASQAFELVIGVIPLVHARAVRLTLGIPSESDLLRVGISGGSGGSQ